jgi:hypothetical protein
MLKLMNSYSLDSILFEFISMTLVNPGVIDINKLELVRLVSRSSNLTLAVLFA